MILKKRMNSSYSSYSPRQNSLRVKELNKFFPTSRGDDDLCLFFCLHPSFMPLVSRVDNGHVQDMVSKHGSWFSHGGTARAQIFRAHQATVRDKDSMFKLMRYSTTQYTCITL